MERKIFELEIKELTEEGQFSGYLSTFGNVDAGGDMVEPGAFKKTLREKKAFPLNWGHIPGTPDLVVGSFGGEEDTKGLKVDGGFFLDLEGGKKAYLVTKKLFEKGIPMGLSMGYKTMKYVNETIDGLLVRKLKEVKLKEGALTLFPMNEEAGLEGIKSEEDLELKPSEDNHVCRMGGGDYVKYRSEKRKHKGKEYTVRYGITKAGKAEEYEYFYPKATWSASEARDHCNEHGGRFIPAKNKKDEELCFSCSRALEPTEPDESPFEKMAVELKASTRPGKPSGEDEPGIHSFLKRTAEELKNS